MVYTVKYSEKNNEKFIIGTDWNDFKLDQE